MLSTNPSFSTVDKFLYCSVSTVYVAITLFCLLFSVGTKCPLALSNLMWRSLLLNFLTELLELTPNTLLPPLRATVMLDL